MPVTLGISINHGDGNYHLLLGGLVKNNWAFPCTLPWITGEEMLRGQLPWKTRWITSSTNGSSSMANHVELPKGITIPFKHWDLTIKHRDCELLHGLNAISHLVLPWPILKPSEETAQMPRQIMKNMPPAGMVSPREVQQSIIEHHHPWR